MTVGHHDPLREKHRSMLAPISFQLYYSSYTMSVSTPDCEPHRVFQVLYIMWQKKAAVEWKNRNLSLVTVSCTTYGQIELFFSFLWKIHRMFLVLVPQTRCNFFHLKTWTPRKQPSPSLVEHFLLSAAPLMRLFRSAASLNHSRHCSITLPTGNFEWF